MTFGKRLLINTKVLRNLTLLRIKPSFDSFVHDVPSPVLTGARKVFSSYYITLLQCINQPILKKQGESERGFLGRLPLMWQFNYINTFLLVTHTVKR